MLHFLRARSEIYIDIESKFALENLLYIKVEGSVKSPLGNA